jgi:hypothetical protein
VRCGAEVDVGVGQPGQFGDAQAGLCGEQDQRVVTAPGPGGSVRGGEQRGQFGFSEPGDQGFVVAFGRDGQDPGDGLGVLGVAQRCVAEQ